MDCGATCLRMIASFYGKEFSLEYLRELCYITKRGVTLLGLNHAAEKIGFETLCAKITLSQLCEEVPLPCILHWNNEHYVVLYKISQRRNKRIYHIADPIGAKFKYSEAEFANCWLNSRHSGIVLCLKPTEEFHTQKARPPYNNIKRVFRYISPYKRVV